MQNNVSFAVFIVGCFTIIGGLVAGVATWTTSSVLDDVPWLEIIYNTSLGVGGGVLLFGFAEIIDLLDKIARKGARDVRE